MSDLIPWGVLSILLYAISSLSKVELAVVRKDTRTYNSFFIGACSFSVTVSSVLIHK